MHCPSCGAGISETSRFCNECGAPIHANCASCGASNLPTAKFCATCGTALAGPQAPPQPAPPPRPESTAERRRLSVMFCDLIGSTELSSKLDPEDLNELIRAYQARVVETISRYGGFIARYMGDGVLVYFGWPEAGENDAERAVHAALVTAEAIAATPVRDKKLRVRIGIATGLVVVGDQIGSGESREQTAIGETPNRAARLQALAAPGGIVIDAATRRQIGELFDCQSRGAVPLKGLPEPVETFDVLAPRAVQSRFEALRRTRRAPLIGREEELEILFRRWGQAKTGQGRLVLISGEPGIGKSRLLAALDERLRGESLTRLRYFCAPHQQASPLYPVIGQLEFAAGFERENPAEERRRKLGALLAETATGPEDEALLADLLSLPTAELPRLNLSPRRRKERTFDALIRRPERLAAQSPVLMLFEDVHWADPSTLELMDLAIPRLHERRVLVVITFRPEFQAPWIGQAGVTLIALSRLEQAEAAQLAAEVTLDQVLPPALLARIVAQAEGVPLYIEELTKAVLESRLRAAPEATAVGVPETLQASLMVQLDRLPLAKQVAQIGAVIGREFGYELIRAVADMAEPALAEGLGQLVASGLVFRRGEPPDATYMFKHALLQDAAYGTLLRARRAALHGAAAAVLERDAEIAAARPSLIAHHYAEAGLIEQAIDYRLRAGKLALARSATAEAIAQLRNGLQGFDRLADSSKRLHKEIDLQVMLAGAFTVAHGQASPESRAALDRAYQLAQETADSRQLTSILHGLWLFHLNRAELKASVEKATALLDYIHVNGDPLAESTAHRVIGISMVFLAEHEAARAHFSQALALKGRMLRDFIHEHVPAVPPNPVRSLLSWSLLLQGHLNEAHAARNFALADARESHNPHSLAITLHQSCVFDQLRGDLCQLQTEAAELIALTSEQGFAHWLATGTIFRGWCMAMAGEREKGLAEMQRGLKAKQATGAQLKVPYYLGLIASLLAETEPEDAVSLFADALSRVEQTGERWFEPELHRLKAEALLRSGITSPADAEPGFHRALTIAREQGARFWELRASVSLARVWQVQGRETEVNSLLAPLYDSFTEDFDLPDLIEARALLSQTGANSAPPG